MADLSCDNAPLASGTGDGKAYVETMLLAVPLAAAHGTAGDDAGSSVAVKRRRDDDESMGSPPANEIHGAGSPDTPAKPGRGHEWQSPDRDDADRPIKKRFRTSGSRERDYDRSRDFPYHENGRRRERYGYEDMDHSGPARNGRTRDDRLRDDRTRDDYRDRRSTIEPHRRRRSDSTSGVAAPAAAERDAGGPRRKLNVSQEERKRGQRLFGGLLTTLSQTARGSRSAHTPTRPELDRRQLGRSQQQHQHQHQHQQTREDGGQHAERMAKLGLARNIQQVEFDEEVMHTRHANMLALAHNLQTKAEPKLFYLPYKLSRRQEQIIEDQIQEAEDTIERERREFQRQKAARLEALGVLSKEASIGTPANGGLDGASDTKAADPPAEQDCKMEEPLAEAAAAEAETTLPASKEPVSSPSLSPHADDTKRQQPPPQQKTGEQPDANDNKNERSNHLSDMYKQRPDHDERDRDVMVETEEDTVLY